MTSEEEYFDTLVRYILNAQDKLNLENLAQIAKEGSIKRSDKVMTAGERFLNEGIQQGLESSVRQGLLEGIEGMLEVKFGITGLQLMDRIKESKNIKQLEESKNYIKIAKTLEELETFLKKI